VLCCEKLSQQLSVVAGKFTDSFSWDIGSAGRGLHTGPPEKESTGFSHTSWERIEVLLFCLLPYKPTGFSRVLFGFLKKIN
jgi:hypothetical protein